jgi:pantoate--beta-alanine ligase
LQIFHCAKEFGKYTKALRGTIGFVPTMGALHEGHISLIARAKAENDHCVVSIFVNPTQFLAGEDLAKYPRKDEADKKICELAGVDAIFMPTIDALYGHDEPKIIAPNVSGYILDGERRPGHFDGVLTVVMKLFMLSNATNAYFGQKDAQQLLLIRKMVSSYFLPVNIVLCPTVREKDGLAMSSRNIYLSQEERSKALCISKSLFAAGALIGKGELDCKPLDAVMRSLLDGIDVEYIAFCDRDLRKIDHIEIGSSLILVAVRIGSTRLIDNLWI